MKINYTNHLKHSNATPKQRFSGCCHQGRSPQKLKYFRKERLKKGTNQIAVRNYDSLVQARKGNHVLNWA